MCKYSAELWSEARSAYVESDSASHEDIAKQFKIRVASVRHRAAPAQENWTKLRKARQRALVIAERSVIQQKAEVSVEAQVEARAEYKRIARKLKNCAERYLDHYLDDLEPGDTNPDKLTKIAATIERCQNIEWTSMGLQRVLDGDLSDRAARIVYVPTPAESEQGDQPGEPDDD